jgi:hypothetical protein
MERKGTTFMGYKELVDARRTFAKIFQQKVGIVGLIYRGPAGA